MAGAPKAVRTVVDWGWGEPGQASPLSEVAFILKPENSHSQELSWGARLTGKAGPGSPRPGALSHPWVSLSHVATTFGPVVEVKAAERHGSRGP